jgi:hypothetical protein
VVKWPCQVGLLALTTKNRNCHGSYLPTLFEKQKPEAKSYNIRLPFGKIYHFALHPLKKYNIENIKDRNMKVNPSLCQLFQVKINKKNKLGLSCAKLSSS